MPKFSAVVFVPGSSVASAGPLGERLFECAERLFRAAGVEDVRRAEDSAAGLRAFPHDCAALFLAPLSCALARPGTPAALMERLAAGGVDRAAVAFPTFAGRRGEPALLSGTVARAAASENPAPGAPRRWAADLAARFGGIDVPVADANVLFDAEADSAETRRRAQRLDVPTVPEAEALWAIAGTPERVRAHCRGVAGVALAMARALNAHGSALDLELVESSALLHDVLRTTPGHARAGAALLDRLGFGRAARIVAAHGDVRSADVPRIGELELIYLADKMVRNDRRVTLEERFGSKIAQHAGDAASRAFNLGRLAESQALRQRIETAVGADMRTILAREGNV